jgi:N-methylhydantoinase A/oxoprolinase/acetone carboxylase beta subunit
MIHIIACSVLARDIEHAARKLNLTVTTEFLPKGLHQEPEKLRRRLQTAIDQATCASHCDRIVVGYGVCGRGTVGIQARAIPLSIPRVHDCIALFLGGDHLYQEQFKNYPGTYYITEGWLTGQSDLPEKKRAYAWMGNAKVYLDDLVNQYGLEKAQKTFAFLNSWRSNYQRAVYIDTGLAKTPGRARQRAMKMAAENNWKYEALQGDTRLLTLLLTTEQTSDEILVVPPKHAVFFDALNKGLCARPLATVISEARRQSDRADVVDHLARNEKDALHFGLGIDAGGTYTDAVVYDFAAEMVRCKCKALTTRWDLTKGIREALAGLDQEALKAVELVSVSTTLATNAIVEDDGRKVGLLIMPPPGWRPDAKPIHSPQGRLSARLDITGKEIVPLNEQEVRDVARQMCQQMHVEAFAVSGYAGCINPEHELRTKQMIQTETGKFVSCGHELSQMLNFKLRAETAVHNAKIVPCVIRLLKDVSDVLKQHKIDAPVMVVRGDGTLMGQSMACKRPVETILSGPAASVAGVRYLTNARKALVVDMGGTTTDIAMVQDGGVRLCRQGARIGSARTHVKALRIDTTGLGGDSLIDYHDGKWQIGPRRVAPLAWLGRQHEHLDQALDYLTTSRTRPRNTCRVTQLVALNHGANPISLSVPEQRIVDLLADRPYSLSELSNRLDMPYPGALPLKHLESHFLIQRAGLTPTDLLHIIGQLDLWSARAARRMAGIYAKICNMAEKEMINQLLDLMTKKLTMAIISSRLETFGPTGDLESCETCKKLFNHLFNPDGASFAVHIALNYPIIGVGAPVGHFLPRVARLLETEAIIPDHQDVANAIGAITSHVSVRRHMTIKPAPDGKFYIQGLAGNPRFDDVRAAEGAARQSLVATVREMAKQAGTSQTRVTIRTKDEFAVTSLGEEFFLGRRLSARLQGRPDSIH